MDETMKEFNEWFSGRDESFATICRNHAMVIAFRAWEGGKKQANKPIAPKHEKHPPMDHFVKCHTAQFGAVRSGLKYFEWRKFDRPYQIGDRLVLQEYDPVLKTYSGESEVRPIVNMISGDFGMPPDYCILYWNPAAREAGA